MRFQRTAGILLHPTSLPGKFGIGDLGNEAYNFINFLAASGQKLWQVFPLGPTGYGDSPYQCFSAFAGNPNLVSPEKLKEDNLLSDEDVNNVPQFDPQHIDYGTIIDYKKSILHKAYDNFKKTTPHLSYVKFCDNNADWLDDYSLFMAAKEHFGGGIWTNWDKDLIHREKSAMKKWQEKLSDEIGYHKFVQHEFFKQWRNVKYYANTKGIKIIGDMPIFIAYDSADLWANKELFTVDKDGKLEFVAGVPPDYFSATGQLWGNPLFKWKAMEKDDFLWWRRRIKNVEQLFDMIRIDHFRGFDAFWEIPANSKTAITGRWVKAPGHKFFTTLKKHMGELPIIAEDLGVITKSVRKLRDDFDFPGMKILQFAFGTKMETKFLPHNIVPNSIVMTGSHDNDTTRAYYEKAKSQDNDIYAHTQRYLNYYGDDIVFELIRAAYRSVADLVVIPMQDLLNLGEEARMNYPGKLGGNWAWRFTWNQVPNELARRLNDLAKLYERPPEPIEEVEIEAEEP
ncbi:MAG TPA: 4-alpha-glucanotransferase [Ignavibacteriaceae bacterium]|nr:4-alpha-glucanotransferase [Ignavibacteriaceae bacterium]